MSAWAATALLLALLASALLACEHRRRRRRQAAAASAMARDAVLRGLHELAIAAGAGDAGALVRLGEACMLGAHPWFGPNVRAARACLRAAAGASSGDLVLRARAAAALAAGPPAREPGDAPTAPLPGARAEWAAAAFRAADDAERTRRRAQVQARAPRAAPILAAPPVPSLPSPRRGDAARARERRERELRYERWLLGERGRAPSPRRRAEPGAPQVRAPLAAPWGAQNVHDSTVTRQARDTLASLRRQLDDGSAHVAERAAVERARDLVLRDDALAAGAKADALRVIDTLNLNLNGARHSAIRESEAGALRWVLGAIDAVGDAGLRGDARHALALALASGVEHGHVVCSTGKITRIVSALDGIALAQRDGDPGAATATPLAPTAPPAHALRVELFALAARMRDQGADADAFVRSARAQYATLAPSDALEPLLTEARAGFD